ncbi:MAG: superoxide dismutase [Bacteroidales bacterium]|nr:superoxide dismutase [Bacteroidales bacterium]
MKKFLTVMLTLLMYSSYAQDAQVVAKVGVKVVEQAYVFAPLPYAYDALEPHIDKQTMEIHYDRHHRAYYNNFVKANFDTKGNGMTLEQIFDNMDAFPDAIRNNAGGYYNHEFFWSVMSPNGGGKPVGRLDEAITETFGSFEDFKKLFESAGVSRFGSGWAWLSVNSDGKLFISSTANQDNPLMNVVEERGKPILAVDVWEHAYYLKYQNKRGTYLSAFWNVVNWEEVARRYMEATQ